MSAQSRRFRSRGLLLLAAIGAACAPALPAPTEPAAPSPTEQLSEAGAPLVLASGEFDLPAANAFGEPGFHAAYSFTHEIAVAAEVLSGKRLVVSLWDASRPDQVCGRDHPLSGCATVDWSDAEGRPNVPPGGVFDNSLTIEDAIGIQTFYLSESDVLADAPDRYDPG
ncbi:MAG: hypothetical protein ACE5FI_11105 [Anaerolineales bacterium]